MSEPLSLSKVASGVKKSLKDPTTQVTLASAAGGSLAAGTCGAAVGLFSGGALGAAIGVIPAVFTFGLSIPIGAAIGSGAGICTGTALGGSIGVVGGGAAGYLYKTKGERKKPEGPVVKFFNGRDIDQVIPLPPRSYPQNLQGIIWMDQGGAFGKTDVPFSAPDLALSFGDTAFSVLDTDSRTIDVDVAGPAWQWMNAKDAYVAYALLKKMGFFYHFQFNEDYSHAQIYPSVNLGALGKWSLPKLLMSFTMVLQQESPETTSPAASTLIEDRAKWAKWDRVSSGLMSPLLGKYGVFHYYVYQIVDREGRRVQPYYDACTSLASKTAKPDSSWTDFLGLEAPEGHGFVGLRHGTASSSTLKA